MCYAIPGEILSINGENAVIDYGGLKKTVNISLLTPKVGDFVLVHAGFAIEIVDKKTAEQIFEDFTRIAKEIEKNEKNGQ